MIRGPSPDSREPASPTAHQFPQRSSMARSAAPASAPRERVQLLGDASPRGESEASRAARPPLSERPLSGDPTAATLCRLRPAGIQERTSVPSITPARRSRQKGYSALRSCQRVISQDALLLSPAEEPLDKPVHLTGRSARGRRL